MTDEGRTTQPVFLLRKTLPDDSDNPFTVRELCTAAEKCSGYNSVIGAQRIGGLWRIYPKSSDARAQLLLKGIGIRGHLITPFDKNPFIVKTSDGEQEIQTTKVVIGNLPLSYSNEDIERKLDQLGCQLQSKLMMERDRDDRGGLTRWLTGRRFVYIRMPDHPLPERIEIGRTTASVYHKEQKQKPENSICSRCFTKGHNVKSCRNEVVCRTCRKPGHKSGHPSCQLTQDQTDNEEEMNAEAAGVQENRVLPQDPATTPSSPCPSSPAGARPARRGRASRQATLSFSASRSLSREKRRRSPTGRRQSESEGKAARRDESGEQGTPPTSQQPDQSEDSGLTAT